MDRLQCKKKKKGDMELSRIFELSNIPNHGIVEESTKILSYKDKLLGESMEKDH